MRGNNNVQPHEQRNLLIAPEESKSLNPNRPLSASYDQSTYESINHPLHLFHPLGDKFTCAGPDGIANREPGSSNNSNSNNNPNRQRLSIGSRRQDSPEAGEKVSRASRYHH